MNLPNKLTTVRLVSVPLFVIIYLIPYQSLGISMPTFDILSTQLSLLDIILFVIFGLSRWLFGKKEQSCDNIWKVY